MPLDLLYYITVIYNGVINEVDDERSRTDNVTFNSFSR